MKRKSIIFKLTYYAPVIPILIAVVALLTVSCSKTSKDQMSSKEKYEYLYGDKKEAPKEDVVEEITTEEPTTVEEEKPLLDEESQKALGEVLEDIGKGAAKVVEFLEEEGIVTMDSVSEN